MIKGGMEVEYMRFVADMETGTLPSDSDAEPLISLRWSDTKGRSWGNPVTQSLGQAGQYLIQPSWNNLGQARDRIFELSWTLPARTALNGAFIMAQVIE